MRGVAAGTAVERFPSGGKRGVDPCAAEQQRVQLRREAVRALPAQQQEARHVLVDLGLQLERQARDRPVMTGVVRDAEKMADALERGPAVGDVVLVELVRWVVALEPLEHRRVEVQRHAQLVVHGADEELLVARRVAALAGQRLAVGDEEVRDAASDLEIVDARQQRLEPAEGVARHVSS
jgi:hypothetical protein